MNRIVPEAELVQSQEPRPRSYRRICIVTAELAGPFHNGGIGTANRALALVLHQLGHEVHVLYTRVHQGQPVSARGSFSDHVEAFRKLGIKLMCIDHEGDQEDWQAMSYLSMQHLLHNRYDIAFFDDYFGTAYYPLLARHTGNPNLSNTAICITAHAPFQWLAELDQIEIKTIADVRWAEMERRCSELADALKAPSNYMLKKYQSYGWTIPENSIVLPNFVSAKQLTTKSPRRVSVREIVFFGRLETRKGLWMFCRAVDRLKYQLKNCQITFLGKPIIESGLSTAETLVRHSTAWPFSIRLLTTYDQAQALTYLKAPGRLAVMPSPEDNSPSTIIECIEDGIPFIASSGSGGEELLDEESRNTSLFEPTVDQLCAKLIDVLERGAITARASFEPEELRLRFAQWLMSMLDSERIRSSITPNRSESTRPILLVVIPPGFHADKAVAELSRAVRAYKGKIKIQALTAEPATLGKLLLSKNELSIDIADLAKFETVAQTLARGEATVVGLCHITQLITPTWIERAQLCFATQKDIAALTGMAAAKQKQDRGKHLEPYFSTVAENYKIERYLTGYCPPLLPLAQETNSGFVLMRSEMLAKCSKLGPVDERYDRLKHLQDWIHEILVTLHASGEHFELVPDLLVEQSLEEVPFEVFGLGRFMRSLPNKLFDYQPGTDQFVLSRFAIDRGLERERSFAHAKYVREIAERIGTEVKLLPLETAWDDQARQLAIIAHASGQIELAIDLSAGVGTQDKTARPLEFADYLRCAITGQTVNLIEAVTAGDYAVLDDQKGDLNLGHNSDRRVIEIKTNPAGPQGIILPHVDLTKITHFESTIAGPETADEPVRFRVELISIDTSKEWAAEKIVSGGDKIVWSFECPQDFRGPCIVRLGVEAARWRSKKSAVGKWFDPRFIRQSEESVT